METRITPLLFVCVSVVTWAGCKSNSDPPAVQRQPPTAIRRVLLISIDTCRADHIGCYGFGRPTTPHLDELASDGTQFKRVISPVPLTLPSHCSMLTGTNPTYHGVHDNHAYRLADDQITFTELAKEHGLATGAIVSAFVLDAKFGLAQGFDDYQDDLSGEHLVHGAYSERKGDQATRLALEWLDRNHNDDFFLFLHYFDPHEEYDPPEPFATSFADDPYSGEIAFTDDCIGRVLQKLKDLGLYDSTLILVTGDHGELLGEHGEPTHSYFIYRGALEVPWIIKVPGCEPGGQIEDIAGLIDIVPTLCGLMDIEPPESVQGIDWSPRLRGDKATAPVERAIYCESATPTKYGAPPLRGAVGHDGWKYIHAPRPELFDLNKDPEEAHNRIDDEADRVVALQNQLEALLAVSPPRDDAEMVGISQEDMRRLASLGYVGGATALGDFEFEPDSEDPKDLFQFHMQHQEVTIRILKREYAQAITVAEQMIRERPDFSPAHKHLAKIALAQGQLSAAKPHLEALTRLEPDDAETHTNLGLIYRVQGELEKGLAALRRAVEIDPGHAAARNNLAHALLSNGAVDEAIDHLQQALATDPDYADAHYNLAQALVRTGRPQQAHGHLRAAMRGKPNWAAAMNSLARLLAISPDANHVDVTEAVLLAEQAARLTGMTNVPILDTLAAAYAAAGEFDRAVATAQQAIDLATQANAPTMADEIRARLELYKQQQSYREPLSP